MRKAVTFGIIALGLLVVMASATPAEDDGGSNRRDAGTSSDDDDDDDSDAGGGNPWTAELYGIQCTSDSNCSDDGWCGQAYTGATAPATCWKKCADVNTDCADFPYPPATGMAVQCSAVSDTGPAICWMASGQNGPCGNPLNAGCATQEYAICGMVEGVGSCVRGCNPNNAGTNYDGCGPSIDSDYCGCLDGDHCSATMVGFSSGRGEDDPDGICAPATNVGDTCGYEESLTMIPCTDGQVCDGISQSNPVGTCAEPVLDGGVEDA